MSLSFTMQVTYEGEYDVENQIDGDRSVTFKLAEIRHYTQDFNDIISRGQHSGVYRGVISGRVDDETLNGKEIAVKAWLCSLLGAGREPWKREVAILSRFKYDPHIIELIGKCSTSERLFLVFPFFNRGDLEHNISDPNLKSDQALGILEGIAKAINKLHRQTPPLIYRDLKPSNILLMDNFSPVLADFETVATANESAGSGTPGYVETQFGMTGLADKESDVFSFGILMLLVLMKTDLVQQDRTIKQAYQLMEEAKASRGFVTHPIMRDKYSEDVVERIIHLAMRCLSGARGGMIVEESLDSRPDMQEILSTIQLMSEEIENQKIADGISSHHQPAEPDEGTSSHHQPAEPDEGTSSHHEAAEPDEGTSTHHEAAEPDEGTSSHHEAAEPDEGTSSHHEAAEPDEGTSTDHEAAEPDEGTSSRSSDHQITQTQPVIPIEPPQIVRDETQISVQQRSTHEQSGPVHQPKKTTCPCFACCIPCIPPRHPPEPEK